MISPEHGFRIVSPGIKPSFPKKEHDGSALPDTWFSSFFALLW